MWTQLKKALQQAIYPNKCISCGVFFHSNDPDESLYLQGQYFQDTPLARIFQNEMAEFLCRSCVDQFSSIAPSFCRYCGNPFQSPVSENHVCGRCITHPRSYEQIRSAGVYQDALMQTIHQLKYGGKIQLARPLGRLLFGAFVQYFNDIAMDWIVPVPLHRSKLRSRGFNQVTLLLKEWPNLAKTKILSIDFNGRLLKRIRKTPSQTGLGRKNRQSNIKGAFKVLDPEAVCKKQVMLVDDVLTTGATVEECAKTLLNHGAAGIYILTLARVL